MKTFLHCCIFFFFSISSFSQASNTWAVKFSNAISTRWTTTSSGGKVCIDKMTSKGWEYSNSIVLHGMEKVYNQTNTPSYLTYIQTYVDNFVNSGGGFSSAITLNTLDKIHPGIICLFLYEKTGLLKYKTIATTLKNVLVGIAPVGTAGVYHRTANGIFWHKDNGTTYDNVVMLDGMYMAHPFLAKYGRLFGDNAAIDTAVNQTLFTYNQLRDPVTHLIKHAWTSTPGSYTWDGAGGNSNAVWSRAMGWYMMALVDILKYVPAAHPKRGLLLAALNDLAIGIKNYQDATSGLWYQVVDETPATVLNNYLETSGSAMFVYALKTACDSNWITPGTYLPVAQSGWTGLKNNSIDLYTPSPSPGDSLARINNFAPAMSVLDTKAAYAAVASVDCPATTNPHGYAAILMAASVMEFPLTVLPVRFASFTAKEYPSKTTLTWQMGDESDGDHYEVQKSTNGNDFTTIGNTRATGISTYTFDDNIVESKTVYYRINAVYNNGSAHYSVVLSVVKNNHTQVFGVSPNPVKNGDLNIVTNNFKPGKYKVSIIGSTGHIVYTSTVNIAEGISSQRLQLPAGLPKGIYHVQLTGEGITTNKNILVE